MRTEIIRLARKNGMRVASAGTHPFSNWADQKIFPDPRYDSVVQEMQQLARANLIFGLHVHVGIKDRALAFQIMNEALYFLPHLLALSTNSPFWLGRNTGLKSFRTKVFDRFPRTSMPEYFETPAEFDEFVRILVKHQLHRQRQEDLVGRAPASLLRDDRVPRLRRSPCASTRRSRWPRSSRRSASSSTSCALQNLGFRRYRRALILENKWRASRYGIDGKLIDFGKEIEVPFRELVGEMLEFVDDVVDELGSRRDVEAVNWILENGTGADRQLRVYEATGGDLKKVVDYICEETSYGLPVETVYSRSAS